MSGEGFYELIKILKLPVFVFENGKWQPFNDAARYFDHNVANGEFFYNGKRYKFLNVDPCYIKGVFHDIRLLIQRIEAGSKKAIGDLKEFVNDFLFLNLPEPVKDWVDICTTLKSVVSLYEWKDFQMNCEKFFVEGDHQYLFRIILNIVDNLNRHSTKRAKIEVKDGKIIFKGSGNIDKEGEGLRIIKELVKKLDGSISVKADNGEIIYILELKRGDGCDSI